MSLSLLRQMNHVPSSPPTHFILPSSSPDHEFSPHFSPLRSDPSLLLPSFLPLRESISKASKEKRELFCWLNNFSSPPPCFS